MKKSESWVLSVVHRFGLGDTLLLKDLVTHNQCYFSILRYLVAEISHSEFYAYPVILNGASDLKLFSICTQCIIT